MPIYHESSGDNGINVRPVIPADSGVLPSQGGRQHFRASFNRGDEDTTKLKLRLLTVSIITLWQEIKKPERKTLRP